MRKLRKNMNQSGASLIFVLASMLLLLAIGGSAMAAASLSRGAVLERYRQNQLNLLADSVQRTVGSLLTGKIKPDNILADRIYNEIAEDVEEKVSGLEKGGSTDIFSMLEPITMSAKLAISGLPQDSQEDDDVIMNTPTVTLEFEILYTASFTRYQGTQWTRTEVVDENNPELKLMVDTITEGETLQELQITRCEVAVKYIARQRDPLNLDDQYKLLSTATYSLPIMTMKTPDEWNLLPDNISVLSNPNVDSSKFVDIIRSDLVDGGVAYDSTKEHPTEGICLISEMTQKIIGGESDESKEGTAVSYEKLLP
jgi:hypothetical protein